MQLIICFKTFNIIFRSYSSFVLNCWIIAGITLYVYFAVCFESIKGIMKPIALRYAPRVLSFVYDVSFQSGIKTSSNAYIPYGAAASAKELNAKAVIDFTFLWGSSNPCLIVSTNCFK